MFSWRSLIRLAYATRVEESALTDNLPILVLPWSWADPTKAKKATQRKRKMILFKRVIDLVCIYINAINKVINDVLIVYININLSYKFVWKSGPQRLEYKTLKALILTFAFRLACLKNNVRR